MSQGRAVGGSSSAIAFRTRDCATRWWSSSTQSTVICSPSGNRSADDADWTQINSICFHLRNLRIISPAMKLTPMLEQYFEIKRQVPDAILFYRLGDFYEMFFEDAEKAAPLLD